MMSTGTVASKQRPRVLVVEDEGDIQDLMVLHLKREGYEVSAVADGVEAIERLKGGGFDLLVLDWMLPGSNGLEIAREVRAQVLTRRMPILMVTARTEAADIVLGLEAGCDDYVTKPFEIPVFLARARALLRRAAMLSKQDESAPEEVIRIGPLVVDGRSYQAKIGDQLLELTPSEFKLLQALVQNRGRVLTRERLIDCVQGAGVTVVDRAIDTHVFGLRKKLGEFADIIETVRGVGYRVRAEYGTA
jgi:two-component system phosphate regulon response regulator PhoB